MTSAPNTELKIIEAAIACIERYGLKNMTVRRIAQEAGVNVAAINYHFRSKEQMMQRVLEVTLENAFDWSHFESSETMPPKPRLSAILDHMVMGTQLFPETTRMHFSSPRMDSNSLSYQAFIEFLGKVYDDLVARGAAPGEELRLALIQAVTATILGIGLHADICQGFIEKDLRDPEVRRRYIERVVDKVL